MYSTLLFKKACSNKHKQYACNIFSFQQLPDKSKILVCDEQAIIIIITRQDLNKAYHEMCCTVSDMDSKENEPKAPSLCSNTENKVICPI